MKIDVHIHFAEREAPRWAIALRETVSQILANQKDDIMPTLDELNAKADTLIADVTAETDLNNAIALVVSDQRATIVDLKAQLEAAGTDPVKLQALSDKLDALAASDKANDQIIVDAITANSSAATPPA